MEALKIFGISILGGIIGFVFGFIFTIGLITILDKLFG
ncbi:hypothetical protein PQE73_gp041 [Bacillus phage vB_BanS_MrDarsey]|uniref:Uncharacterized protein n=1 Tax=Bacillus phage vB_BanS_MrDarsey TaxID=2894787 RepID=A0AAE8YPH8_9CAUD|nr:hypothetical protein PQE73_gp041 [Bacillus phage vB_BanS_MrDarsey]UGO47873.1 hypothetical protein MRDARSEY_41 [Bacillus phage vB_BanS_MrDarsey]